MSNSIHAKILDLIKSGACGPPDVIDCEFVYKKFVPRGVVVCHDALVEMRDVFYEIIMKSSHPTLNPFMDEIIEMKEEGQTFKETLLSFIEKNVKSTTEDCDSKNDVMTMKINMEFLIINCLYFFDQEEILIEKASIQTTFFKHTIEG
tara:strand:+ start:2053 stop:2496 length:444 start_codon:yes stop_codon:yes gene_type:complete